MPRDKIRFLFLNVGHFVDHFFVLIFASAAALQLTREWGLSYAELIPYATPGLIAFGLFAVPAGWLADKWSREGMMAIFFIGIGASSIIAGFASTPFEIGAALTLVGIFAAIYHPVGLAMVVQGRSKMGVPLAINGIFGNMGVACAALLTGLLIDYDGWRSAFQWPGIISIVIGITYLVFERNSRSDLADQLESNDANHQGESFPQNLLIRIFAVIFFTTAVGGIIFQSTTFALPKIMDERLGDLAGSATEVGLYTFLVFSVAAFAQLAVGYLIDRYSVRIIFAGLAFVQAVLFAIMIPLTGLPALIIAFAFMLTVFGEIPINDVLVGRVAHRQWRSRAYSFSYIIGFSVSASAVPLIAWIHGGWGFEVLFGLLAVCAFVIFIAALFLPPMRQTSVQP